MKLFPISDFTKPALRKQAQAHRAILPMAEISAAVCERIASHPALTQAQRVLFYHPIGHELDLRALTQHFPHKVWCLPVVISDTEMRFQPCGATPRLSPGKFGILEPDLSKDPENVISPACISPQDLMIVPGLLFDRQGQRLGYGKGYFDRFLSEAREQGNSCLTLGAVPSELFMDAIPADQWDIPVQWVVTERETLAVQPA